MVVRRVADDSAGNSSSSAKKFPSASHSHSGYGSFSPGAPSGNTPPAPIPKPQYAYPMNYAVNTPIPRSSSFANETNAASPVARYRGTHNSPNGHNASFYDARGNLIPNPIVPLSTTSYDSGQVQRKVLRKTSSRFLG